MLMLCFDEKNRSYFAGAPDDLRAHRKLIFFIKSHHMEEINIGITNLLLLLSKEASMSSSVLSSSSSSSLSLKELMGGKGGKELKLGNGMQLMSFFCLIKKNMIR